MRLDELPKQKRARFGEKVSIPIDRETRLALDALRERGVDVMEWLRSIIARELGSLDRSSFGNEGFPKQ